MAKNMQPILKRCKALGIGPTVVGVSQRDLSKPKTRQKKTKRVWIATE